MCLLFYALFSFRTGAADDTGAVVSAATCADWTQESQSASGAVGYLAGGTYYTVSIFFLSQHKPNFFNRSLCCQTSKCDVAHAVLCFFQPTATKAPTTNPTPNPTFSPTPLPAYSTVVEYETNSWTSGGQSNWVLVMDPNAADGYNMTCSGNIGDREASWLQMEVRA